MLELLVSDLRPLLQDLVTYAIFIAAVIWGAGPERATIATWVVFLELPKLLYKSLLGGSFQLQSMDLFLASSDVLTGVLWVAIALYANRNYTLIVAGLQVLAISSHLARGVIESMSPLAYAIMYIGPGWLQLIVMAIGLWRHAKRERRFGPYREWRVPLPWLDWLSTKIGKA